MLFILKLKSDWSFLILEEKGSNNILIGSEKRPKRCLGGPGSPPQAEKIGFLEVKKSISHNPPLLSGDLQQGGDYG